MTESRSTVFWIVLTIVMLGAALIVNNVAVTIAALLACFMAISR